MAKFEVFEDEWYPVVTEPRNGGDRWMGGETVDLTDEELARVRAAYEEFFAVQTLLRERMVYYPLLSEYEALEQEAQENEDPQDPFVKYEDLAVHYDRVYH